MSASRRERRDRGDTMLMSVILIGFLMVGSLALINASDAWGHRRELQQIADAAARAGAQLTSEELRASLAESGSFEIDYLTARWRANQVIPKKFKLERLSVDALSVTVVVTGTNQLPYPSAGGATGGDSASSTATADLGIIGDVP